MSTIKNEPKKIKNIRKKTGFTAVFQDITRRGTLPKKLLPSGTNYFKRRFTDGKTDHGKYTQVFRSLCSPLKIKNTRC